MSVLRLIAVAVTLVIAAIVSVLAWANWPIHLHHGVIEVTIPPKTSMQGIARMVSDSGAPIPALLFDVLARADGRATHIQAGTYAIEEGLTPLSVLARMERGEVVQIELVIPEGWTFHQMRAAVASDTDLQQTVATLDDATLMHRLGATESSPEGLFFPDTYRFARGTPDIEIYRRAYLAMAKHLRDGWAQRAPDLPLDSPYQALILASIIEKETGRAEDRALISAVFNNRLRKHMLLQTDPSVIYGLGTQYDGSLHKADLTSDTPYNTYVREGLPPTPIALPGQAALTAALNPAASDLLYFVSRGDGTSQFSASLDEHNRAVGKYQKSGKP
jgi:UPF0755 protein